MRSKVDFTTHICLAVCALVAAAAAMTILDVGDLSAAGSVLNQGAPAERVPVPEPSAEALRYYNSGMIVWALGVVLSLAIPTFLLFSGISGRLWDRCQRHGRSWLSSAVLFTIAYFTIDWLLDLPLAAYRGFVRPHAYGLSSESLGAWLCDSVKGLGFLFMLVVFAVPGTYAFIRSAPRRWWIYASLAAVATTTFIILISPVWVAPAFDDFGRMRDPVLEREILDLGSRAGIGADRVFEVAKSAETQAINAYVSGLGATRRIVLWDTLVDKLDREQVLFVMGHEMGHYVLRHMWYLVIFNALLIGLSLFVAHRSMESLIARFSVRFRFERVEDLASLPLLLLIAAVIGFALQPVQMAFGRYREHEADRFALELTRDNHAGATSFVSLTQTNLSNPDPGPVFRLFRAGHPVAIDRIEFANDYRPWEDGGPLRYGHLMSPEP